MKTKINNNKIVSVAIALKVNSFDYYIPKELEEDVKIGTLVVVEVRSKKYLGIITKFINESKYKLKPIEDIYENIQLGEKFVDFLKWISSYYFLHEGKILEFMLPIKLKHLAKANHPIKKEIFIEKTKKFNHSLALNSFSRFTQKEVIQYINDSEKVSLKKLKEIFKSRINSVLPKLLEIEYIKEEYINVYKENNQYLEPSRFPNIKETKEQKEIIDKIYSYIKDNKYRPCLLQGVTGSGKTEVYYQLVKKALALNKTALILLPEIALTDQTISYFLDLVDFSDIAIIHSKLTPAQKSNYWYKIALKQIKLVIGARSAVFTPLKEIGIIIVDEEQDNSYKQSESSFRYNARDLAILKAFQNNIPVVLGTATPSLESKLNAINRKYHLFSLKNRINDMSLPEIKLVDLKNENISNEAYLSKTLIKEIKDRLEKKEQIIIYLNKRGYHSNLICKSCGYVFKCENCDVSYTYYKYQNVLKCHYCDAIISKLNTCPNCSEDDLTNLMIGTEKVYEELKNIFPQASIERFDRDIIKTHKNLSNIIKRMKSKDIDILIGTQMVVKGHHFPNTTLVALLLADQGLNYPSVKSAERTFQDLVQVSGRAGRAEKKGSVVVQAFNTNHYVIQYFLNNEYENFWEYELLWRKSMDYPPYSKLIRFIFSSNNQEMLEKEINRIKNYLPKFTNMSKIKKANIYKINNIFRQNGEFSSKSVNNLNKEMKIFLNFLNQLKLHSSVKLIIDRDPYN